MDYQAIARKYRPQIFSQVLGQEAIVTTLLHALEQHRVAHAYLFSGPRGTGKTTLARLLAKAVNCLNASPEPCNQCPSCQEITAGISLDVIEVDGATHRGIDDIRELSETTSYAAARGGHKIYILDEVHMLTKEAFNALLKTLEEPPKKVLFLFATTEPHKIPATIISRCQRFHLRRLSPELIATKLKVVAKELSVTIDDQALHLIAQTAEGGMRDAESLLDQVLAFQGSDITEEVVASVLGLAPSSFFVRLDQAIEQGNLQAPFEMTSELFDSGVDFAHFLTSLIAHHRSHLLAQLAGSASLLSVQQRLALLDLLLEAQMQFKNYPSPRFALEILLTQVIRSKDRICLETLVQRLSELEKRGIQTKSAPPPPPPSVTSAPPPGAVPLTKPLQGHHDTLMRFATVELEGQFKR